MRSWETTTVRHGTTSGYRLHQELGENPCDACARAKRKYDARWKAATPNQQKNRLAARAQAEAHEVLRHRYPDEYRAAYTAARDRLYAEAGIS